MAYTAQQALDELKNNPAKYDTADQLKELVKQLSIESAAGYPRGSVTVLYSSSVRQGGESVNGIILEMRQDGADMRVIDTTEKLRLVDFFDPQAIAHKIEQILMAPDDCAEIRESAMQSVRHCYTVGAGIGAYRRLPVLPAARWEAA